MNIFSHLFEGAPHCNNAHRGVLIHITYLASHFVSITCSFNTNGYLYIYEGAHMDVSNAGFKILKHLGCKDFMGKRIYSTYFVRPRGNTQ